MTVRLVFLGRLEDAAGAPEIDVAAAGPLDALLADLDPGLAAALREDTVRIALNGGVVARDDLRAADGDEVAFLPPVSGG